MVGTGPSPQSAKDSRKAGNQFLRSGIVWLLLVALSLSQSLVGAAPELPSTPAGTVLAGYLDALNVGTKDKLEAFVRAHRPDRPGAVGIMLDLRWNTGGFDLHSVESSQPRSIQAVLHEREGNGAYSRMSVTVNDGDPAVITNIMLTTIPPPSDAPPLKRLSQEEAVASWTAEIEKADAAGKFSGVWMWTRNGRVLTSGAIGKADRERGIGNTLDNRFHE
jgi:hypothetical protein